MGVYKTNGVRDMKFFLKIEKDAEPSVTVVCDKVTSTVKKIEELCLENETGEDIVYGYDGDEVVLLNLTEVACFFTKDKRVCASLLDKEYTVKYRIKELESILDHSFIKINQGCVANVNQIKKFAVSIGGSLKVIFKNGFVDYVSRRETINVKRRFGL